MKILHLSDLHVGQGDNSENLQKVVSGIVKRYKQRTEKQVVLITGDIVDSGCFNWQYAEAAKILLKLKKEGRGYEILACPGNHDYGFMGNAADRTNLDSFKKKLSQDVNYPVVDSFGRTHLIGLDSMEDECGLLDGLLAEGEIGKAQLADLSMQIERLRRDDGQARIFVYLHHHPFFHNGALKLKDADRFLSVVRGKVDGLLFGHKHSENRFAAKEKKYGIGLIQSAGKTTSIKAGRGGKAVFRILEIDTDECVSTPICLAAV